MAKNMYLLWGSGSPPSWRVMIMLAEKNLQGYRQKRLSIRNMAHKTQELLEMNSRGQVPVFKHGERILNESVGICLYLENQFKERGNQLISSCPAEQAMMYQRMMEEGELSQKTRDVMYYPWKVSKEEQCKSGIRRIHDALREELVLWEGYRRKATEPFLSGKTFSLSDVCVYPDLAFLFYYRLSPERYPKLAEYYSQLKERPSIKNTWPPHWLENPEGKPFMKDI